MADLTALAQRYAPLLVFSRDGEGRAENFYPMDAETYIRACALYSPGPQQLVPRGRLNPQQLMEFPPEATCDLYMVFASERLLPPLMDAARMAPPPAPWFIPANVWDDILDFAYDLVASIAIHVLDLIAPQRLPAFVWQEARRRYGPFDLRATAAPPPVLYYAFQPTDRFLILHYWFFYAFNDWGTGHGGRNDHEGDWESVHLFLEPDPPHRVRWLAYAAHGRANLESAASGDVEWFEEHPVVYVGCGSHASYFRPAVYAHDDWAMGDGGVAVGPRGAHLYAWPRIPQGKRPTVFRAWQLRDLQTCKWAWHFRGFWGARFRYQALGRAAHILHAISGPGGPVWLPGQGRLRPQWRNPLAWARFRRYWWQFWRPRA